MISRGVRKAICYTDGRKEQLVDMQGIGRKTTEQLQLRPTMEERGTEQERTQAGL